MAFLRFTRDKRGYEQFSLVEPTTNRRGKSRTRVLYWYRTPPNVRVGREPFDESVRRALEAQNPDVQFDWRKIAETPIPSVETERWRERRRAEKAEKAAHRTAVDEDRRAESQRVRRLDASEEAASDTEIDDMLSESETEITAELVPAAPELAAASDAEEIANQPGLENTPADSVNEPRRRRRRRRGGRGRRGRDAHAGRPSPSSATHEPSATPTRADAELADVAGFAEVADVADETKPEPEGE